MNTVNTLTSLWDTILGVFGLSFVTGAGGTLGVMLICKVFRWAPVSITMVVPDAIPGKMRREKVSP